MLCLKGAHHSECTRFHLDISLKIPYKIALLTQGIRYCSSQTAREWSSLRTNRKEISAQLSFSLTVHFSATLSVIAFHVDYHNTKYLFCQVLFVKKLKRDADILNIENIIRKNPATIL